MSVAADSKGERTRTRLLEVAIRRVAADGFRGTSVAAVAREVGVSPTAVYAYFPNKEGLFEAAVDADSAALILEALAALAPFGGDFGEEWPAFIQAIFAGLDDHPLARRVLAGHEREALVRLLSLPALADLRAVVAASLATAQQEGEVRTAVEPGVLALGFETIILSLLMSTLMVGEVHLDRQHSVIAVMSAAIEP